MPAAACCLRLSPNVGVSLAIVESKIIGRDGLQKNRKTVSSNTAVGLTGYCWDEESECCLIPYLGHKVHCPPNASFRPGMQLSRGATVLTPSSVTVTRLSSLLHQCTMTGVPAICSAHANVVFIASGPPLVQLQTWNAPEFSLEIQSNTAG